ncbi:hypothetical protein ACJ73_00117 [Blastomyces percursus]|uniref:Uncharacterized protein n=1 Tax=Blastomyces percursus TaxID=1658174 RepID=A0A1J9QI24_9EURO|nr:hypothetical protein ACJ73_00117 [Blastomyces percursus]
MTPSLREHAAAHEIPGRILDDELLQSPELTRIESSNCGTTSVPVPTPAPSRSVDSEPGSSPENPIDLEDSTDQEHDTQPQCKYREASPLGGDTERDSDSETVDGRNSKATSAWNLEKESQAQPQLGHSQQDPPGQRQRRSMQANVSFPNTVGCRGHTLTNTGCLSSAGSDKENVEPSSPQAIPTELADNVSGDGPSKDAHATVSDSFAPRLEPDGPHILLHREAGDGRLEFLVWAPIWRSEGDVANVAPDQLKRYKERLDVGGLPAGPLRRESEQGPLFQSLGDHYG